MSKKIVAIGGDTNGTYAPYETRSMNKEILEKFIKEFPIREGKSKNPYIILFDAYTGMGKSTVAREIAKHLEVVILNNDEVRHFLNDYDDTSNLKDNLQKYRLEELLKHRNNCILDSCFCHNYQTKLDYYNQMDYKYYIIRLECSDKVVKERLSKRTLDGTNYSIADYNRYLCMKENVERVPLEIVDFIINTEQNLEPQIINITQKILEETSKENRFKV